MDTGMKRTIGGALIGALLLLAGLVLRMSDAYVVGVLSGLAILGGGLVAFICVAKIAVGLMRS